MSSICVCRAPAALGTLSRGWGLPTLGCLGKALQSGITHLILDASCFDVFVHSTYDITYFGIDLYKFTVVALSSTPYVGAYSAHWE
jgi:hypothetical protein